MKSVDAVLDALERGPAVVIPLVRQANPAIVKRRPAPGEWSIHENACHLAEVHPLFFRRQRTARHAEYNAYSIFIMFRHLALHDFDHAYRIEELLLRKDWPSPDLDLS